MKVASCVRGVWAVCSRVVGLGRSIAWVGALAATGQTLAQTVTQTTGPDIIVCSFPDVSNNPTQTINGIVYDSFAVGTTSANRGSSPVNWWASPDNRHPAIAQNLFRYIPSLNRFEQLGQGALKHGFTALQNQDCASPNYFNFGCTSTAGTTLGTGCSDPYCCGLNNDLGGMGPKWQVNAATGLFQSPYNTTWEANSAPPRARLTELQQAPSGTRYFMEGQYVVGDDAAASTAGVSNKHNNATWQEVTMSPLAGATGTSTATNFSIALTGNPAREKPAIYAWQTVDASVQITTADVPGDGRFILAVKVSGTGPYTYEYALQNLNSHRCAGSFVVPLPGAQAALTSIGFHDVEAVSEPNALSAGNAANPASDDWVQSGGALNDTMVSWGGVAYLGTPAVYTLDATPFHVAGFTAGTGNDHTANVIRWGTMFNFRFTSTLAPVSTGSVAVGLWRPGTGTAIVLNNIPTPGGATVGSLTAQCCTAGVCSVVTQAACTGTWGLPGTTCSPDPCALGTCCDTGACTSTTMGSCTGTGTWSVGGSCTPNPCPAPTGACCPNGGACTVVTQAACPVGYQGHNTSCAGGPCPPGNDLCANAIWLADNTPYTGVNTNAGTDFPGGSLASCGTGTNSSVDVWFKYKPTTSGNVRVTTNTVSGVGSTNFDTVISVHASCGATTSIGCNDDSGAPGNSSNIAAVALTAGNTYMIRVAGYGGAAGTYTVRVVGGGGTIPTGACCTSGTCSALTEATCTGTYQGDAVSCSPSPCPQPSGSCCAASGDCTVTTQASCTGTWTITAGCSPNNCPQPAGVCCRGATCATNIADQAACSASVQSGSTTLGVFVTGSCNASGNAISPCCYADYNKAGGITVGDIFDFLNDWFAGYKYAVVGNDGVHGVLAVQHIFDFLGVWFAGGC